MANTPQQPPLPPSRPNPLHGQPAPANAPASKEVPLPHMPPRPEGSVVEEQPVKIHPSVEAEQEAGKAAMQQAEERLKAEQEYGAKMSKAK